MIKIRERLANITGIYTAVRMSRVTRKIST